MDFVELSSHRAIRTGTTPDLRPDLHRRLFMGGAGGAGGMVRGGCVSESATKALRAGIGGEQKRGRSTVILAPSGSIGAFVADLDNPPGADRPGRASVGRAAAGAGAPASERGPRAAVTPFWGICGDPVGRTRRLLRLFSSATLLYPLLRSFFSYSGGRRSVVDEKKRSGRGRAGGRGAEHGVRGRL